MLEKVAAAQYERMMALMRTRFPLAPESEARIADETWETCGDETRRYWRAATEAGLTALLTPTTGIMGELHNYTDDYDAPLYIWQSMIRAALEGK